MATYTTRLRDYIESFTDWKDINATTYDKIEKVYRSFSILVFLGTMKMKQAVQNSSACL